MDSIPKDQVPPQEVSIEEKTQEIEDDGDDLISNLPDSVLCHILSKLPTKHAVATAILSTRWKNLFASIPYPSLDFDDSLLLHPKEAANSNPEVCRTSFINFVDRVLNVILYDMAHITRFHLKCDMSIDDAHIIEWICNALLRHVRWLDLDICLDDCGLLFDTLSGSRTLLYLKLSGVLVCVRSSFCLPNLKCLSLESVEFLDDESIYRLFTGCPVLEDLGMRYCDLHQINIFNISSPSLKVLIILQCYIDEFGFSIVLHTPGLEMFFYEGCVAEGYPVKNLNSLLKACLVVGPSEEQLENDGLRFNQNVAELVKACCSVRSLLLSKVSIAAVEQSSCPMTMFRNLTKLELIGFGTYGWELLPQFLECAPNLEFLDIKVGFYEGKMFYEDKGCYARFKRRMPESVPVCLSSHLEKIQIRAFTGEEDELRLVRYFLKKAKVLKRIEISSNLCLVKILYYRKILSDLPRLSETCQLLVLNRE